MKALSIHPVFAGLILIGDKTIECRSWSTEYRGDLLICSTAKIVKDTIPGHALCVVTLADVEPFTKKHLEAACMTARDFSPGLFAWRLENLRLIKPMPLKGKLGLWNYDGPIEYLPIPETQEEDDKQFDDVYGPLIV